jgi:hypothetical protein
MLVDWKDLALLLVGVVLVCLGFVGSDGKSERARSWTLVIIGAGLIIYSIRFLLHYR